MNFRDPTGLTPATESSEVLSGFIKGSKDTLDMLLALPKGAWGYYNHLLNATGYTDLVKGHEVPICQCQAQLELDAIIYVAKNHKVDSMKFLWEDIKERPVYYIGGLGTTSAIGVVSKASQIAVSGATGVKVSGSAINAMSEKINKFTGCY